MAQTNFISAVPIVQPARMVPVTPNNSVDLAAVCKGLYIDVAGTLTFLPANNTDAEPVAINVAAGTVFGCFTRRVLATGTSATGIFALY